MYHPDRVNFPLKRAGDRGEGKWQKISWDMAFDEISQKLSDLREKYGAEAVAIIHGGRHTHKPFVSRFQHLFGTPNNIGASSICLSPQVNPMAAIFGWPLKFNLAIDSTSVAPVKSILLPGANIAPTVFRCWKLLLDMKAAGAKIIVVDPKATETTKLADLWLQIRPGTDTALYLAMINVIIAEGLYDKEFVAKWCHGFNKVVRHVRDYTPEKVADVTWLPAEKIKEAARMFAMNKPNMVIQQGGIEQGQDSIEKIHAQIIMVALMGNIDVAEGRGLTGPAKNFINEVDLDLSDMLSPEQKAKQLGAARFPLSAWPGYDLIGQYVKKVWGKQFSDVGNVCLAHAPTAYRAMITGEPYPVKAAICIASNPMVTQANTKLVYRALKSLELFVVADFWRTPSAELADYILPAAWWPEKPYLQSCFGKDSTIQAGEQALPATIPGEYEHKTDFEIMRGLAIRLGQEEYWPWETLEQAFDYQLKPRGLTHKEFMAQGGFHAPPPEYKKYEKVGFATPTGKVELYSTIFEKLGRPPLPSYKEPFETPISQPELAKEYPLMLLTGTRIMPFYQSALHEIEGLRSRHPYPLVKVHPETAKKFDIQDGDWIWIESPRGRIRMKCQYFKGIDPRVVDVEFAWWFPELPGEEPWLHGVWESNDNVLTEDDPDVCNKYNGGWPLKTSLCKIYKCKVY
jgi:anaerobic selenocysteine-containing dehydrogenase